MELGDWTSQKIFVRTEIEAALRLGVPVIPTLVTNATMPSKDALPESIRSLADLQGMELRPDPDFQIDIKKSISRLAEFIRPAAPAERPAQLFLQQLLKDCQDWYNDIVQVVAKMLSVLKDGAMDEISRQREIETLNFIYVNTRTYLPRVMSARRSLTNLSGTDNLAEAIDGFLSNIIRETADREWSTACQPPIRWALEIDEFDRMMGYSSEDKYSEYRLDFPLHRAGAFLERIANEIGKLSYPGTSFGELESQ
jgi:hypothetical protein